MGGGTAVDTVSLLALVAVAATAAAAAAIGTAWVRRIALRRSILDIPNERSSHVAPTPRGGGAAIVAVCVAGWVVFGLQSGEGGWLAACALGVALVSAVDDVRPLGTGLRMGVHLAAAVALGLAVGGWETIEAPVGELGLGLLGLPLAVFWLVGLTNAYNFMDGIDGIAATQAVVGGAGWALAGAWLGNPFVSLSGGLVAGGSLGFAIHNWPPARIFMGDVGSAFLGFVFAGLALYGEGRLPLASLLFVWPFVFDAAYTFVRRAARGENVFKAHRSHLYQRLVIAGWSHRRTTMVYAALAVWSASCGLAWLATGSAAAAVAGLGIAPLVALGTTWAAERSAPGE